MPPPWWCRWPPMPPMPPEPDEPNRVRVALLMFMACDLLCALGVVPRMRAARVQGRASLPWRQRMFVLDSMLSQHMIDAGRRLLQGTSVQSRRRRAQQHGGRAGEAGGRGGPPAPLRAADDAARAADAVGDRAEADDGPVPGAAHPRAHRRAD